VTTRAIRTEQDRADAIRFLQGRELPFTVNVTKGAPRSIEQNSLQRMWLNEAQEQGDQTAEEYRAYCKLHLGVPILRNENEIFRQQYENTIRPLPYEAKLEVMKVPIDLPVTRIMTSKQKAQYLDAMYQHFRGLGMQLTEPKRG
jgi:hypothetical protein